MDGYTFHHRNVNEARFLWGSGILKERQGEHLKQHMYANYSTIDMSNPAVQAVVAVGAAFTKVDDDENLFAMMMVVIKLNCLEKGNKAKNEDVPGKGNSRTEAKVNYMRAKGKADRVFLDDMNHLSSFLFVKITVAAAEELENFFRMPEPFLNRTINPRQIHIDLEQSGRESHKRTLLPHTMIFMFLYILQGRTEGTKGLFHILFTFGTSDGKIFNHIRHVSMALFDALVDEPPEAMVCKDSEERRTMRSLVFGFPDCVVFVDGTKQYCFSPKSK